MAWIGVVTNEGRALLDQYAQGDHTLNIDGASVGSGTVAEANMRVQTEVTSEKDDASIVGIEAVSGGGTKYEIQVGPASTAAYVAHQIGLWASIDEGDSKLLMLLQDAAVGVSVPLESVSPRFAFSIFAALAVDNSGNLTVNIDQTAYVTLGTMQAALAAQRAHYDNALAKVGLVVYDDQFYIQPYEGEDEEE